MSADLHFWFDPVCPFAWMTSEWVRVVARQRDYAVDWRFISLRLLNRAVDYDAHFPPEYEAGHTAGLRLLRVAARAASRARPGGGRAAVRRARRPDLGGAGGHPAGARAPGQRWLLPQALGRAGLPADLAEALDDSASTPSCRRRPTPRWR